MHHSTCTICSTKKKRKNKEIFWTVLKSSGKGTQKSYTIGKSSILFVQNAHAHILCQKFFDSRMSGFCLKNNGQLKCMFNGERVKCFYKCVYICGVTTENKRFLKNVWSQEIPCFTYQSRSNFYVSKTACIMDGSNCSVEMRNRLLEN